MLRTVAVSFGARFADPLGVFNPSILTGESEVTDIPTICVLTNQCPGGVYSPGAPAPISTRRTPATRSSRAGLRSR